MSSLTLTLQLLEEKLENLQRDTKFCVNNYDYHHKNNEHLIMQNLQSILKDALQEGQNFFRYTKKMRSSIVMARKKCCEIDELLMDLGIKSETSDTTNSCPVGSQSFYEEREASRYSDLLEENKENAI